MRTPVAISKRRARRGQSGATLIEVLVGIVVAVPLTLSSVMGMLVTIRTSAEVETQQRLEAALASATEDVKALPYLSCASAEDYQTALTQWSDSGTPVPMAKQSAPLRAELPGRTAVKLPPVGVSGVSYWDRVESGFAETCSSDNGAQRLELSVTEGETTRAATIVVRDPAAGLGKP